MAVRALLRFSLAFSVGVVRIEGLRAESACRDRRLLNVDSFATRIRRRQNKCRTRTNGCDLAAACYLASTKQEHVVTSDLRVVSRVIARLAALVVVSGRLCIRFDWQVT